MEKMIVETYASTDEISGAIPAPVPASKTVPEWYKNIPRYTDSASTNFSVKACLPYLDAMTAGYTLTTWCDIEVRQSKDKKNDIQPMLLWEPGIHPVEDRSLAFGRGLQRIKGFSDWVYAWNMPWGIKTPEGYSALLTQPLNRPDLPFITVSGITDADNFASPGAPLFCINMEFEGIIPKGTPYLQVIPIKRQEWEIQVNNDIRKEEDIKKIEAQTNTVGGYYKKTHWVKKDYS
jgi:hypothetical protein